MHVIKVSNSLPLVGLSLSALRSKRKNIFVCFRLSHSLTVVVTSMSLLTSSKNPHLVFMTTETDKHGGECESEPQASSSPFKQCKMCQISVFLLLQLSLTFRPCGCSILHFVLLYLSYIQKLMRKKAFIKPAHLPVLCSSGPWGSACSSSSTRQTVPFGTPGILRFSCMHPATGKNQNITVCFI